MVAYLAAAVLFAPAIISSALIISVPLFLLAVAALAAPNAPLDAARLDIMHPLLRGRAEGVRTLLRTLFEAMAPLMFGVLSGVLGGAVSTTGQSSAAALVASAQGLQKTFLIMLVPLAAAGLLLLRARRTYARDVATAHASSS